MPRKTLATTGLVTVLAVLALAGCGPSQQVKQQIASLQAAAAERDSLMNEVSENAKLMSDISAEIARTEARRSAVAQGEAPPTMVTRDSILAGIKGLVARLDTTQRRLVRSERRVRALGGRAVALRKTLADLQQTVANQKETITNLTDQVNQLQQQNARLTVQYTALSDTVTHMVTKANTDYYVIGTKQQLLSSGIVKQEGGHRILFIFGKAGQVLVPSASLDSTQFTPLDARETTNIPLPDSAASYRIVSNQDLSALQTPPAKDGTIRGAIQIADPARFWSTSRYLIVVRTK